jgi:hypothetical protein
MASRWHHFGEMKHPKHSPTETYRQRRPGNTTRGLALSAITYCVTVDLSHITNFLRTASNCTTWKRIRRRSTTSRRNSRRYSKHFVSLSSRGIRSKWTTRQVPPPVWNSVKRPSRSFASWVISNRARYRCTARRCLKRSRNTASWGFSVAGGNTALPIWPVRAHRDPVDTDVA